MEYLAGMNEFSQPFITFLQQYLPATFSLSLLAFCFFLATAILLVISFSLIMALRQTVRQKKDTEKKLAISEKTAANVFDQLRDLEIKQVKLETLLTSEREYTAEKLELLKHAREEMRLQFGSLAQQIFEEKSARFSELNHEKLSTILHPFKDQLDTLKQEINDIYRTDSRERISLKTEITHLRELNQQINQEAVNLTNALKGNTKTQGNWGELVLERVLEKSGLRKGTEYDTQSSFRDHQNRLFKPDIIIHLPAGKDIVIDSKVSLISWEKYINSDQGSSRKQYKQELIKAIREHIHSLSAKNYQNLRGLHSLNFVLMFMPIEAAFATACNHDDNLIDEALTHNIILVTPTTLLATLRTVENIWHNEHQSKNSLEIARRAGLMYDKFRGFVEEVEKIGKQLTVCQNSYEMALTKLCKGRGNLINQAEQLKGLGVQVKKEISKTITEQTDHTNNDLPN